MPDAPGSPVAAAERHDPFTPSNVGPNTPGKRAPTAAIWTEKQFLRLLPGGRRSAPLIAKNFTHVCVLRRDSDGKPCNTPLKLTKNKLGGTWLSTKALAHVRNDLEHASHPLAIQDRRAKEHEATRQMAQQAAFEPLSAMTKTDASGPLSHFVLTPTEKSLSSQLLWYIYGRQHVSKASFDDPYWKDMMRQQAATAGGVTVLDAPLLQRTQLSKGVRAEFEVFIKLVKLVGGEAGAKAMGNPFGQCIHDSGTLANHVSYQAYGMQFVDPLWNGNVVICFGLVRSSDGRNEKVAELAVSTFESRFGLSFASFFGSSIADRKAMGVASFFGHDEEPCLMHDGDKPGASAIGALVRSKAKKPINPFPEGAALMQNMHKMGTHFSYSNRWSELITVGQSVYGDQIPSIRIAVDLNGTRVAAQQGLLYSELRLSRALTLYKAKEPQVKWEVTPYIWKQVTEFEGVLDVTKITTKLAQYENLYTGGFKGIIKTTTLSKLRADTLSVVDLDRLDARRNLLRKEMPVRELTELGKTCLHRATLECERRFTGNKTEELTGAPVVYSRRELLVQVLDIRLCGCAHLTPEQRREAMEIFTDAYVTFAATARAHKKALDEKLKTEIKEATAKAASEANNVPTERPFKAQKIGVSSDMSYGFNGWAAEDEAFSSQEPEDEGEEDFSADPFSKPEKLLVEEDKAKALRAFRAWVNHKVNWSHEYPHLSKDQPLDLIADLMGLDMGPLYLKIIAEDPDGAKFGYIPLMASSSFGQIGALNAESFCERILRAAGHVMTEGNTLLNDEELEMLTVLRINKHFIMKYRKIYREQLNEQFQHTVVRDTPPSLTEQETAKGLKEMIDAGFSPAELGMDPVDAAQAYRMALMAQNKSKGAGSSSSAVDVDAD